LLPKASEIPLQIGTTTLRFYLAGGFVAPKSPFSRCYD